MPKSTENVLYDSEARSIALFPVVSVIKAKKNPPTAGFFSVVEIIKHVQYSKPAYPLDPVLHQMKLFRPL